MRPVTEFATGPYYRGERTYRRLCKPCYNLKRTTFDNRKHGSATVKFGDVCDDLLYDYRFARTVAGMEHERATEWVARGYHIHPDLVMIWDLSQYELGIWDPVNT